VTLLVPAAALWLDESDISSVVVDGTGLERRTAAVVEALAAAELAGTAAGACTAPAKPSGWLSDSDEGLSTDGGLNPADDACSASGTDRWPANIRMRRIPIGSQSQVTSHQGYHWQHAHAKEPATKASACYKARRCGLVDDWRFRSLANAARKATVATPVGQHLELPNQQHSTRLLVVNNDTNRRQTRRNRQQWRGLKLTGRRRLGCGRARVSRQPHAERDVRLPHDSPSRPGFGMLGAVAMSVQLVRVLCCTIPAPCSTLFPTQRGPMDLSWLPRDARILIAGAVAGACSRTVVS
jgi:hypothetical protein